MSEDLFFSIWKILMVLSSFFFFYSLGRLCEEKGIYFTDMFKKRDNIKLILRGMK